jgi:glycosyltransferase involved in cell wall biosynthesis
MDKKKIIFTANSYWYIKKFRKDTISSLMQNNDVSILVPQDKNFTNNNIFFFKYSNTNLNLLKEIYYFFSFCYKVFLIKPDIICSFNPKINLYATFASFLLNIKNIPNISGLGEPLHLVGYKKLIYRFSLKFLIKNSHMIFFQNQENLIYFKNIYSLPNSKYKVLLGSGVNLKNFRVKPTNNKKNTITFIMASRLIEDKGVKEYIEAAIKIKKKYKSRCIFYLLGISDHSARSLDRAYIEKFTRSDYINILIDPVRVSELIKSADCSVLPTYYNEGVPKFLIESIAASNIIITTNTPGCNLVMKNNVNGFFVKTKSIYDLEMQLLRVMNIKSQDFDRMKKNSFLASKKFNEKYNIQAYKNVIINS